jgi:hypothetical protein
MTDTTPPPPEFADTIDTERDAALAKEIATMFDSMVHNSVDEAKFLIDYIREWEYAYQYHRELTK